MFAKYLHLGIAVAAISATPALASEKSGLIIDLQVEGSTGIFGLSGPSPNRPACALWERFSFDLSVPAGQAMLAYLLSAQAMGKRITVYGTGSCVQSPTVETAYSVRDGQ